MTKKAILAIKPCKGNNQSKKIRPLNKMFFLIFTICFLMMNQPNLIQRPIVVKDNRAIVARPIEKIEILF